MSFLSGKGGAGKTSAAIGVSYLLADAGFEVALVDCDLATHGASYFFRHLCHGPGRRNGLAEITRGRNRTRQARLADMSVAIRDRLVFVPSRTDYSAPLPDGSHADEMQSTEGRVVKVLEWLLRHLEGNGVDFVVLDSQAGASAASRAAAHVSSKAIIVAELDPISSDAVDTLLMEMGEVLPVYRRHLINKLDIREDGTYDNLSDIFQAMNRLPPLPFDFDVRAAFSSRRVPVDCRRPNPFTICLFNTVDAMLPECREKLERYGRRILEKYAEYQREVEVLIDKKDSIRRAAKRREARGRVTVTMGALGLLVAGGALLSVLKGSLPDMLRERFTTAIAIGCGILGAVLALVGIPERLIRAPSQTSDQELRDIERQLDGYRSLQLTRTGEFIRRFEERQSLG